MHINIRMSYNNVTLRGLNSVILGIIRIMRLLKNRKKEIVLLMLHIICVVVWMYYNDISRSRAIPADFFCIFKVDGIAICIPIVAFRYLCVYDKLCEWEYSLTPKIKTTIMDDGYQSYSYTITTYDQHSYVKCLDNLVQDTMYMNLKQQQIMILFTLYGRIEYCCHTRFNHIQIVKPNRNIHIDFKLFEP
ncbi:hypothetical protein AGLY_014409 [Aphis glycines]|uniref:Uncharacterized protein n=1 Tax=Aphis glycines TaxID=307491 RepID=A0A6G0T499_APHGL|nr:hypothetical protein AGLY_014409 [Aphis glycines]